MSDPPANIFEIFTRQLETDRCCYPIGEGEAAVFSARSPHKPTDNEDAAMLLDLGGGRGVLAVADGVGGHVMGAEAAETTMATLAATLRQADPQDENDLRAAILNGIEAANEAVLALGGNAATTLAVIGIDGETIRPFHVGDSEILVVGQRSKLKLEIVPHSPVGYAVEAGLIDRQEAMHHVDRHIVSNIVGSREMRIEVGATLTLCHYDTVLLGTDGLFDNLHPDEIIETIRSGPLDEAVGIVAGDARKRMTERAPGQPCKPDDLTIVLYRKTIVQHAESTDDTSSENATDTNADD